MENKIRNGVVHFEIPVDDVERAKKFYEDLFGWRIEKHDMPDEGSTGGEAYYMVYTTEVDEKYMVKYPGAINGGMMKRKHPKQPFMNYINVDEIDVVLPKIKEKGGTILMPKTEIGPNMGWIACFKDPEGNMMGLHQMSNKEC